MWNNLTLQISPITTLSNIQSHIYLFIAMVESFVAFKTYVKELNLNCVLFWLFGGFLPFTVWLIYSP